MSENLILMNDMYMASLSYRFRIDFNEEYNELCRIINTDYEIYFDYKYVDTDYKSAEEKAYNDKHNDILLILRKMIYMLWNCWDFVKLFPKEELYKVINVVKLAKTEQIRYAKDLFIDAEFKELEENYTNSR